MPGLIPNTGSWLMDWCGSVAPSLSDLLHQPEQITYEATLAYCGGAPG